MRRIVSIRIGIDYAKTTNIHLLRIHRCDIRKRSRKDAGKTVCWGDDSDRWDRRWVIAVGVVGGVFIGLGGGICRVLFMLMEPLN